MDQENDTGAAVAEDQELEAESQDLEQDLPDDTDWKAEAIKARRIASRLRGKLTKATETKKTEVAQESKTETAKNGSLDYGEKALLRSEGIKAPEERALVEKWKARTGDDIETILDDDIFQAQLKKVRDTADAKAATPSSTKRSTTPAQDSVDYWIAKGELPPPNQAELRRKVVNAKLAASKKGPFYNS